jgi:hypothetical protein
MELSFDINEPPDLALWNTVLNQISLQAHAARRGWRTAGNIFDREKKEELKEVSAAALLLMQKIADACDGADVEALTEEDFDEVSMNDD